MGILLNDKEMLFKNRSHKRLTFDDSFNNIKNFMRQKPFANYKLVIGTDSQVKKEGTRFITALAILRAGDGAWACRKEIVDKRHINNLHEKISIETSLTEQLIYEFSNDKANELEDIILPYIYQGSSIEFEAHLDIGDKKRNLTREFVTEMTSRVESMGFKAVIKPDSCIASGYANRYTK